MGEPAETRRASASAERNQQRGGAAGRPRERPPMTNEANRRDYTVALDRGIMTPARQQAIERLVCADTIAEIGRDDRGKCWRPSAAR